MQSAMNEKLNSKKNEWAEKSQNLMDKAVSEVKNLNPDDIKRAATEFGSKVRDISGEVYDDSVGYIRRNPVSSALGLVAFGFVAGLVTSMMRKSA